MALLKHLLRASECRPTTFRFSLETGDRQCYYNLVTDNLFVTLALYACDDLQPRRGMLLSQLNGIKTSCRHRYKELNSSHRYLPLLHREVSDLQQSKETYPRFQLFRLEAPH
mmetsp:Transcript_19204/g.39545  ORF Transcript_19204/g.39545 Transcript_19204/m.39545 type:complete len:112 (-) Transcript_19204:324-659(-)